MSSVPLDADTPQPPTRLQRWRSTMPSWRAFAITMVVAAWLAALLLPFTLNSYLELAGEFVWIGLCILVAYNRAGCCPVAWMPKWMVQLLAVLVAAVFAPLVLQVFNAGGSFSAFAASRPHVRGYWLVTFFAALKQSPDGPGSAALVMAPDANRLGSGAAWAARARPLRRGASLVILHSATTEV